METSSYQELYKNLIINESNILIVNYGTRTDSKYNYHFKHHILDSAITEKLVKLLIDNVVFYAYSPDEITNKFEIHNIDDLENAAAHAFGERLAKRQISKTDGLVGELMLDIIVQALNVKARKIFTRAKYVQQYDNQEIKGYDAAYFLKQENGNIELWLGQAKAGEKRYCINGICKDINQDKKYLNHYFCKAIRYICDRATEEVKDENLLSIISKLNKEISESYKLGFSNTEREDYINAKMMSILSDYNVSVIVPCLIMFDSDIYSDAQTFTAKIQNLCNEIFDYFEGKDFLLTNKVMVKVLIIMLPIQSLKEIKEQIVNFKKDVQA